MSAVAPNESNQTSNSKSNSRRPSYQGGEVNKYFHQNNAVDERKMRRIIAEDPDWNLMTVPLLSELCSRVIVTNFQTFPRHDELPQKWRKKVLNEIPITLPLDITAKLVDSEDYWARCCKSKFKVNDVSKYGGSWKRMYFERDLKKIIENYVPNRSEMTKLNEIIELGAPYIVKLDVQQLLPPVEFEKKEFNLDQEDDDDYEKEEIKAQLDCDHFDFNTIVPKLSNLQELRVVYGVRDCGMNFEWQLFEFSKKDCQLLSKCVQQCHNLRSLHINWSKIDDDKLRLFISQILDHPGLVELNLAHNLISDRGSRAIGKFLNGHSKIVSLNLSNNQIHAAGAQAIAHALIKNTTVENLNLRLNRLGDEGGQAISKALLRNQTLKKLNLASNNMTEPTAALISSVISQNKDLRYLDLSSNRLGTDGGKQIQEAMQDNTTLIELDLRLTECGQESEFTINQILKNNYEEDRSNRIENENKLYKSFNRTYSHIF